MVAISVNHARYREAKTENVTFGKSPGSLEALKNPRLTPFPLSF